MADTSQSTYDLEMDSLPADVDLHEASLDSNEKDVAPLSDEEILEDLPEEDLKANPGATITVPKVSASRRSRMRRRSSEPTTTMLTGDPVRMYLKEIGRVPLLNAAEEIDLAMKIEAGVKATEELEAAEDQGIDLDRAKLRRLTRIEQNGFDAKQALIEANLRLVVSIAKRYVN